MKRIPLTQGKVALIDNRDYWLASQFSWCASYTGDAWYAMSSARFVPEKRTYFRLHQLLAMLPPFEIDHVNGDGLDCRRRNLRPATSSQNKANSRRRSDNTSGQKGVCWHTGSRKWMVRVAGRYIGIFSDFGNAVDAYLTEASLANFFAEETARYRANIERTHG